MAVESPEQEWVEEIEGDFRLHRNVLEVLDKGLRIISAETFGTSAWTFTAKLTGILPDGAAKKYFLKCATGQAARAIAWGEHHSAVTITATLPSFCPKPVGKGQYYDVYAGVHVFFYVQAFHDIETSEPPDPAEFGAMVAEMHSKITSPDGRFGYPIVTACGMMERTIQWETSWAVSFSHQLRDVLRYDRAANGEWAEFDRASEQMLDKVIPRLLGALQSEGRSVKASLVHGDLWEGNVGFDRETGKTIIFDPGCTYAHNEIEFGTWRCTWASYFSLPIYTRMYQREFERSEPVEEWDDRNRLYAIRANLNDSAGHPGNFSRTIAYNDMLFLCEKYAPYEASDKYDPAIDPSATGIRGDYDVMAGAKKMDTSKDATIAAASAAVV